MKPYKYLVLDVETANSLSNPLVYDIGFAVVDRKGNIYEQKSFVVYDIFFDQKKTFGNWKMMKSAYYADKIPSYYKGIKRDEFEVRSLMYIWYYMQEVMSKHDIKAVCAYNANFDMNALNQTIRYVTKSKVRHFFDEDMEVYCIWHMACQTVLNRRDYLKTAKEQKWYSEAMNVRTSAEMAWRYLSADHSFEESHTGLKDVEIEIHIMAKCFTYHQKIDRSPNRACWRIPQEKFKKLMAE